MPVTLGNSALPLRFSSSAAFFSRQQVGNYKARGIDPGQDQADDAQGTDKSGLPGHAVGQDENGRTDDQRGNDHGDAHAEDGFCSAVRQAKVKGHLENDRFMVASFELIAEEEHHHHSDEDGHVHN